jgi:GNAT superfamily N-acetyltransferase
VTRVEDAPKPRGETALSQLKRVVDVLRTFRGADASDVTSQIVADDPDWDTPEKTRRHVAMLWSDLQRAVTAEIGSTLVRQVTDWIIDDFTPRIVVGEPHDFDDECPDDEPHGWLPLAVAHRREAGWDFSPKEDSGKWIGWFEPEAAWAIEGASTQVVGMLTAFIVVRDGTLEFAHVVHRRRRAGIATRLIEFAVQHHGLTDVSGILSDDGKALVAELRRNGLLP